MNGSINPPPAGNRRCAQRARSTILELIYLCDQLIAQRCGWLYGEHRFKRPRAYGAFRALRLFGQRRTRIDGRLNRGRGFGDKFGASRSSSPAIPTRAIVAGISESPSHRRGVAVSPIGQTGRSDDPRPEGMSQERSRSLAMANRQRDRGPLTSSGPRIVLAC
jgi:hypothetical protein